MSQNTQPQTPTERLKEKYRMVSKLGALLYPLEQLVEKPSDYDEQESAETIARFCADFPIFIEEFRKFSVGQPGHNYAVENGKLYNALINIQQFLVGGYKTLPEILADFVPQAHAAVSSIPIPRDATIFEAATPFSTYCALKDLFEADTTKNLIWIDAYMNSNVFHRFLRGVDASAAVTLVTSEPRPTAGNAERARWTEFLDVSRLYAQERGTNYRLIVHPSLHDRWLLIDNKRLYNLGGSAKDAANKQYFTLARLDASEANLQVIQAHVNGGRELFGQSMPTHQ